MLIVKVKSKHRPEKWSQMTKLTITTSQNFIDMAGFLQYIDVSFQTYYRDHRNMFCRVAVIHFFMLEGFLAGLFASQLPTIQENAELSDSALGMLLICVCMYTFSCKLIGSGACVLFLYFGTVFATSAAGKLIGYYFSFTMSYRKDLCTS